VNTWLFYTFTSIPSILFSYTLLSFLKVCPSAKSYTIQTSKILALGGYPDWVSIHSTSPKACTYFPFFKKFERPQWLRTMDYQSSRGYNARQYRQTQRERIIGGDCAWILQKTFSFIRSFLLTQKQRNNGINYHHYYPPPSAPSGGPWPTKGRTCDASKSEAGRARI
jgi:hypothetical protein